MHRYGRVLLENDGFTIGKELGKFVSMNPYFVYRIVIKKKFSGSN